MNSENIYMKEKIKKLLKNNLVKYILIPSLLLLFWFGLTSLYIYTFDTTLSVISYIHGKENITNNNYSKLLKGQKLIGEFVAKDDNLGIVSVKFKTFLRPAYKNEDIILFRIKEKGKDIWIAENTYRNGLMYEASPFPFGLPKIPDSKGRRYYFEIESLNGNQNNSIALSDKNQILFSKYQVNKADLLKNKTLFLDFAFKKYFNSLLTTDVRFSSIIYMIPLIFYLIWISSIGKKLKKYTESPKKLKFEIRNIIYHLAHLPLHITLFGIIYLDIFVVSYNNDVVYLVIIAFGYF